MEKTNQKMAKTGADCLSTETQKEANKYNTCPGCPRCGRTDVELIGATCKDCKVEPSMAEHTPRCRCNECIESSIANRKELNETMDQAVANGNLEGFTENAKGMYEDLKAEGFDKPDIKEYLENKLMEAMA